MEEELNRLRQLPAKSARVEEYEHQKKKTCCPICDAEIDKNEIICPVCGCYIEEPAYDTIADEDDLGG
jgi:predicted amidophosphoribosyltransferase